MLHPLTIISGFTTVAALPRMLGDAERLDPRSRRAAVVVLRDLASRHAIFEQLVVSGDRARIEAVITAAGKMLLAAREVA